MKQALLIFVKNPVYGKVKTRLAVTVGNDMALRIYQNLLKYTYTITRNLPVNKTVYYSAVIDTGDCWDMGIYEKKIQHGNDLGARMGKAFEDSFNQGYNEVILIGSDCVELSEEDIINAYAQLKSYDVVIGPATDGGYYLMGLKNTHTELFNNIIWSTNTVLSATLNICAAEKMTVYLLPELSDIDEEKDIKQAYKKILQLL